jgi:hypothetical protein
MVPRCKRVINGCGTDLETVIHQCGQEQTREPEGALPDSDSSPYQDQ